MVLVESDKWNGALWVAQEEIKESGAPSERAAEGKSPSEVLQIFKTSQNPS